MNASLVNHCIARVSGIKRSDQTGIALITSLLILVIMTLLALSMFRNVGLNEKIAGNTREKQRSLQTAQSALQYGEWWLSQGYGTTGTSCTSTYNANVVADVQTCSNLLTSPTVLPWAARGNYLPSGMTVSTSGGLAANGDINYSSQSGLYVAYLGLDPTGKSMVYQVTAVGYGGTANGASVVQSTYEITSKSNPLDQP
jgi:type IV pilus assembly protein PilX